MCLLSWHWDEERQSLCLIGNRDEFYTRPTLPLSLWQENQIVAGKDLQGGGTWLGISGGSRMAALTNYRDPRLFRTDAVSRGALVSAFLFGTMSAQDYLSHTLTHRAQYNPFNLLVYDGKALMGLHSVTGEITRFKSGFHSVSNAAFNIPWPKSLRLQSGLKDVLMRYADQNALNTFISPSQGQNSPNHSNFTDALFNLLRDTTPADDDALPETGVGLEKERALSSVFITLPDYGTRSSTALYMTGKHWFINEIGYLHGQQTHHRCYSHQSEPTLHQPF